MATAASRRPFFFSWFRVQGLGFGSLLFVIVMMENKLEKDMEHEIATNVIRGFYQDVCEFH